MRLLRELAPGGGENEPGSDVLRETAGLSYLRQSGSERCPLPVVARCHAGVSPVSSKYFEGTLLLAVL